MRLSSSVHKLTWLLYLAYIDIDITPIVGLQSHIHC